MVGSALVRALEPLDVELVARSSAELDLRDQAATDEFFQAERPEIVLFAAAKVGGIQANIDAPAEFLYDNLAMATHAIHAAYEAGCERFVFLGSTCVYPRMAPQPMSEIGAADGPAGADERRLRAGEDRRLEAVPDISPAIRRAVPLADAQQPVRAGRQLSSRSLRMSSPS